MKFELVHDCGDPKCEAMRTLASRPAWEVVQVFSAKRKDSTDFAPHLLLVALHAPGERPSIQAAIRAAEELLDYLRMEEAEP